LGCGEEVIMKSISYGDLAHLWYSARGAFCCILEGKKTLYELVEGRGPPHFQRVEKKEGRNAKNYARAQI